MHPATVCHSPVKISSTVKIKTRLIEHASYLINKVYIVVINYLSNFLKGNPYNTMHFFQQILHGRGVNMQYTCITLL